MTIAACALLIPGELGWVAPLSHAWGFNLWQYQHPAVGFGLALALGALCSRRVRDALLRAALSLPGRPRLWWAALVLVPIFLWAIRERRYFGDSTILIYMAMSGSQFAFPEIGATFLLQVSMRIGSWVGVPGPGLYRALVCLSGAAALFCFVRLGRELAPNRRRAAILTAFVLCGGLIRLFAGHVEVYAFAVVCAGAYFWSGCAFTRGRCHWLVPCLVLGCGMWIHLSFIFLIPSLLILPLLAEPGREIAHYARRWIAGLSIAGLPMLLFIAGIVATGHWVDLERAWAVILQMAELDNDPHRHESWVRGWGRPAGAGTRYTIFHWPHLAFLANAFFLLTPVVIPVLVAFLRRPRAFVATRQVTFLTTASAAMLCYTAVVRPVWGPYDWDVFSLTAICLAVLAGALLVNEIEEPLLSQLSVVLIGVALTTVTIPFLISAVVTTRDAGPFSDSGIVAVGGESSEEAFERQIGPWL